MGDIHVIRDEFNVIMGKRSDVASLTSVTMVKAPQSIGTLSATSKIVLQNRDVTSLTLVTTGDTHVVGDELQPGCGVGHAAHVGAVHPVQLLVQPIWVLVLV